MRSHPIDCDMGVDCMCTVENVMSTDTLRDEGETMGLAPIHDDQAHMYPSVELGPMFDHLPDLKDLLKKFFFDGFDTYSDYEKYGDHFTDPSKKKS